MKNIRCLHVGVMFICAFLGTMTVYADVPELINIQGVLTDTGGDPVPDGGHAAVFSIYEIPEAGTAVWAETLLVATTGGLFTVNLGEVNPVPVFLFELPELWLGIKVEGDPEMTPRVRLTSTPYGYHAAFSDLAFMAETVGDDGVTGASIVDGSVELIDLGQNGASAGQIIKWNGGAWEVANDATGSSFEVGWLLDGNAVYLIDITDSVGINTTVPQCHLDVNGQAKFGRLNTHLDTLSAIMGGNGHTADSASFIGGGEGNTAIGYWSTIAGGGYNFTAGNSASIGGGNGNYANGFGATLSGGNFNMSEGNFATVGGGYANVAHGYYSVIAGGGSGTASQGDTANFAGGNYSAVGGGRDNRAEGVSSVVSGGQENQANADRTTIGGGYSNVAGDVDATVAGGQLNTAYGAQSFIGGGESNTASGWRSTIAGGYANSITSAGGTIGGGLSDSVTGLWATISGGFQNMAGDGITDTGAVVGGGYQNKAVGSYSTVGGGKGNSADTLFATIGGGRNNSATELFCTIGGGAENSATSNSATIAGGFQNTVSGHSGTVGGGVTNSAAGYYSTVAGGNYCIAGGNYSFAAGRFGHATHDGAFVWADGYGDIIFNSAADNEFAARVTGGVRFVTGLLPETGVQVAAGGGSWSSISDRNAKENFEEVDNNQLLRKLAALPVSTWNYKTQDESIRHIGPMAQDFYAAFGVGEDDRHITSIDADGVALAAIKALHETQQELREKVKQLEQLEIRVAKLEKILHSIGDSNSVVSKELAHD